MWKHINWLLSFIFYFFLSIISSWCFLYLLRCFVLHDCATIKKRKTWIGWATRGWTGCKTAPARATRARCTTVHHGRTAGSRGQANMCNNVVVAVVAAGHVTKATPLFCATPTIDVCTRHSSAHVTRPAQLKHTRQTGSPTSTPHHSTVPMNYVYIVRS